MLRRLLSVILPNAMLGAPEPPRMKTIEYRGVVTFCVPSTWKEEYQPEGGSAFYEEAPGSGTLRLNIISAKAPPGKLPADGYHYFLRKPLKNGERLSNIEGSAGDGILFSKALAEEGGQKLMLYTWEIAHCVPPDQLHIAIFTWTILASQAVDLRFQKEIEFIGNEISKAQFHSDL